VKILIINGKGRSGKDEFVNQLEKYVKVKRYSTVDNIKSIAQRYFYWDGQKDNKGRKLLSDLKIASIEYNNQPHEDMIKAIQEAKKKKYEVFTCMIRDIPEIEKACKDERINKDVVTVLISSNRTEGITYGNVADDNVYNYIYDYYVKNDGTLEDLKDSAEMILYDLGFLQVKNKIKKEINIIKDI
jgi:hypothetical protein